MPLAGLGDAAPGADHSRPWKSLAVTVVLLLLLAGVAVIVARRRLKLFRREARHARYTRTLLDSMRDAVVLVDPASLRVLDVNAATEELTGFSRAELLRLTAIELRVPEEREAARSLIAGTAGRFDAAPAPYRINWLAKDGRRLPLELAIRAITLNEGEPAVLGTAREISEQLRTESELAVRARQQAAVAQLGTRALIGQEERTLPEAAVALVAEVLAVELVIILELSPDGASLRPRASHGWDEAHYVTSVPAQPGTGPDFAMSHAGYTLLSDKAVVVEDFRSDPRGIYSEVLQRNGALSGIALSIRGTADPYGTLAVYSRNLRRFSSDDVSFLETIANIVGATIERSRTAAALSARRAQQEALSGLGELALAGAGMDELLDSAAGRIAAAIGADHCIYFELQPDGASFRLRAGTNRSDPRMGSIKTAQGPRSLSGYCLATNQTVIAEDIVNDPRFDRSPWQLEQGVRSTICVPIPGKAGTIAQLGVFYRRRRRFSADDVRFMEAAAHILATAIDRRRAEEALQSSELKYRLIVETAQEGIWAVDPSGTTTFVNTCMAGMLGFEPIELVGRPLQELLANQAERGTVAARLERCQLGSVEQYEVQLQRRDGTAMWVAIVSSPLRDDSDGYAGSLSMVADLSERQRADEFHRQATHDGLTGLPNRRLLADRLQIAIKSSQRSGTPVTVLYLDLDRFKRVNDELGHEAGDQVLIETAERLAGLLRASDTVARIGGDEFAIVLPETDAAGAGFAAQKIIDAIAVPFAVCGTTAVVAASVGVAQFPDDGLDPRQLLQHADAAMYIAKRAGGGIAYFANSDPGMRTVA